MRETGGENPVRRDLGRHRIAKSGSRGERLRDRADAADPRRQRQRLERRTPLQDLLEAAIQRRRDLRAHDPPTPDIQANFEIALDALSGPIVMRVMAYAWPSGGRAARPRGPRSHSAAPAAASPTSTGPRPQRASGRHISQRLSPEYTMQRRGLPHQCLACRARSGLGCSELLFNHGTHQLHVRLEDEAA